MQYDEVVNRLKELGGQASLSSSDKADVEAMYRNVLGRTFTRTSCGDCYHDAVIEIYSYLKKNRKMKEKSNYALKNGVLLQIGFGSGEMYTNDNLTDEAAERYLAKNSKGIVLFATTPTDWEERIEKRMNTSSSLDDVLVTELVKALKVEDATVKTVKEVFKVYQLDGKKITAKLLDAHIKEAQSLIESEATKTDDKSGIDTNTGE